MDILLLSASARKRGNCDYLLQGVKRGIIGEGLQTQLIYLADLNINTCQGCLACVYKGKCPKDDDVALLLEKIVEAKGLVLGAPTYIFSATGLVKTLTDRSLSLSPYLDVLPKDRWALTISVAGNEKWNYQGIESVNLMALAYQYRILDYMEAFAPGPGEVLLQDDLMAAAQGKGKDLAKALLGTPKPRPVDPNQCPSCYSKSFRFLTKDTIICPFCGLQGRIGEEGPFFVSDYGDTFFAKENLKEHLISWVFSTRERFLENIPSLKERRKHFEGTR